MESLSTSLSGKGSDNLAGDINKNLLPREFYSRDTIRVAKELLGKLLIVRARPAAIFSMTEAGVTIGRIVETEAYQGNDPASHSCRGETPRCSIMFGDPGYAYVYFIYGMYEMLNFVTEPKGKAGAVLIRAIEPLHGEALMRKRTGKGAEVPSVQLLNGPGKLTKGMGIKMRHNGESLLGPSVLVSDQGYVPAMIMASPRVGISEGRDRFWRFFISDNKCVSKVRENKMAVLADSAESANG